MNRRILTGALLMIILWGTTLAAAGLGEGDPLGLPETWHVPDHLIGDRGRYTVTVVEQKGDEVIVLRDELPLLDFAWLDPTIRIDSAGVAHHVFRLATQPYGVGDEDLDTNYAAPIYEFDSTTDRVVSYTYERGDVSSAGDRSIHFVEEGDIFVPPCGTKTPLAGNVLVTSRPQSLFPQCSWHAYWAPEKRFHARALDDLDGHPALYFEQSTSFGTDTHLWLGTDHPYPLRFAVEDQDHPGRFHVIRLATFERGDQPLVAAQPPEGPGPMRWVDYDGSLPDVVPDHPFSAREAYEASIAHPDADDLRSYRQEHPNAHFGWTLFSTDRRTEDGAEASTSRKWSFLLADGASSFAWGIEQRVDSPVPGPNALASLLMETNLHYSSSDPEVDPTRYPGLDDVPSRIPDPAWLYAMWQATTTDTTIEVGWQVAPNCQDPPTCNDLPFHIGFGARHRWNDLSSTPLGPGGVAGVSGMHLTQFDYSIDPLRGDRIRTWEVRHADCTISCSTDDNEPLGLETRQGDVPHALVQYETGLWGLPSKPTVVGAGLVSLVVSLLYWLWPTLKSGLLAPLFSRIQGPQVAEHPRRQAILDLVAAEPGISMRGAQRRLGEGRGSFDHHLRKLVAAGMVKQVQGPGHIGLFIPGQAHHGLMQAATAAGSPGSRAVLDQVAASPGSSISQVARDLGLTPATVHHHVGRLRDAGLVDVQPNGRAKRLFATATGEATRALGAGGA